MPHIVQKKQEEAQDKERDCSLLRRKKKSKFVQEVKYYFHLQTR